MLLLFLKSGEKTRSEAADDELNKLWQAIIARQTSVEVHLPPFKWTKSVSAALARYVGNLAFPPSPPPHYSQTMPIMLAYFSWGLGTL